VFFERRERTTNNLIYEPFLAQLQVFACTGVLPVLRFWFDFTKERKQMKIAITALAAIAGVATASPYVASDDAQVLGLQDVAGFSTMTIDISGIETWDEAGSAFNTVLDTFIGSGVHIIGLGWDVFQISGLDSGAASWLSEMTILMGSTSTAAVSLATSATGAPGSEANSSGGLIDLVGSGLDFFLDADGIFSMEFYESFVDEAGAAEGVFGSVSTISIAYVPTPGTFAMLGLGGLVAGRRRR
jgi:hypothetical protein